ncbi:hydrolase [Cryptococcus neoformans]|uniref:Hydrolase n=2 Tax=Cryptococcus neoformans TaxID=5207 RepID=A0A854QI52_CRYNE|nr:hydrolase [Cryptococcus neoformans var. grubii H99]AUB23181.1 hydrolase [Cryptococcus neoformans var. grubii]OWT40818.1 hydrolase [Cryptococcus neoformans var. grubii Bt1]OWZ34201.1 hydrolase [Cryptococcus neoformans var. grubii AD2-60a]OWZ46285.1 hydrolase [Cryptococcus neoformans var. grubii C23]OWZ50005.1 hydrolase [Cryptococcus neoformans var. grubii AD1-83a]OWZ55406.1 hydrolase [Cryptococcus neoformans var. grubii 125.91]OWZ79440.1 hydrolase [Cryptococcus neoformans var. grubii Bt85]|eukprot:XP_012047779.1 hydrolase [Cryptococcus neoformans var. grubii H99]
MASLASCIFCKIIKGEIPSMKLLETESVFAFMDVGPIAKGHCLVIPKHHTATFTELPDEAMVDILPTCKKLAAATGAENYNILQNNGRPAHQVVDHVHFHVIPKPAEAGDKEGLVIGWPTQKDLSKDEISKIFEQMKSRL